MGRRSYDQFCPAALALDVIGERWTLLIVRELSFGQKRYTDLLGGLPGIGPNVLAARLKHLQEAGIVRRTELAPPAASRVYELTEFGNGLKPVLSAILHWGLSFFDEPEPTDSFRLDWMLGAMRAMARVEATRGLRECYEFRVSGHVCHVEALDGEIDIRPGPADDPAVVVTTDFATFAALGGGQLDPAEAAASGRTRLEGDPEAAQRLSTIFGVDARQDLGEAA